MKEVVFISGKGGTGKTSIAASCIALAENVILADCDVDAADLHLLVNSNIEERTPFMCGHKALIRQTDCIACGDCARLCRFEAIIQSSSPNLATMYSVDQKKCEGCGVCVHFCPSAAIDFNESESGELLISKTKYGTMVHARLYSGGENSGKLVSTVRQKARQLAETQNVPLVIVDGPPGVACPVIATITGASLIVIITEPTVSGRHDMERVLGLVRHFGSSAAVIINKWDINPEISNNLEAITERNGATLAGRISYDPAVTKAQLLARPVIEMESRASDEIRSIWKTVWSLLDNQERRIN